MHVEIHCFAWGNSYLTFEEHLDNSGNFLFDKEEEEGKKKKKSHQHWKDGHSTIII